MPYETNNFPKQNYFKMKLIKKENYNEQFFEITNRNSNTNSYKVNIFYIYADSCYRIFEKKVLNSTTDKQKQEYMIGDNKRKVITIDNEKNRYQLRENKSISMEELLSCKYAKKDFSLNKTKIADNNDNLTCNEHSNGNVFTNSNNDEASKLMNYTQERENNSSTNNNENKDAQSSESGESKESDKEKKSLIFFKFLNVTNNTSKEKEELKIKKIVCINHNNILSLYEVKKEFNELLLQEYKEICKYNNFYFDEEKFEIFLFPELEFDKYHLHGTNEKDIIFKANSVLLVGFKEKSTKSNSYFSKIVKKIEEMFSTLFLSIYNIDKNTYLNDSNRYYFNSRDSYKAIVEKLYRYIRTDNLFPSLLSQDTFYFTEDRRLLNYKEFGNSLTEDNIQIIRYGGRYFNGDLGNYINPRYPPQLDFKLKFIDSNESFDLCNIDGNFVNSIFITSLRKNPSSNYIIDLLYEPALKKIFPQLNKQSYYIILENPEKFIIYDTFTNKEDNICKHFYTQSSSFVYKFRIQPFNDLATIADENEKKIKVFLTFITRDNLRNIAPMVLMINNNITWKEMRELILLKLRRLNVFKNKDIENKIIHIYHCKIDNGNGFEPVKCGLITSSHNDRRLLEELENKLFFNLMVELPMIGIMNSNELSFN